MSTRGFTLINIHGATEANNVITYPFTVLMVLSRLKRSHEVSGLDLKVNKQKYKHKILFMYKEKTNVSKYCFIYELKQGDSKSRIFICAFEIFI